MLKPSHPKIVPAKPKDRLKIYRQLEQFNKTHLQAPTSQLFTPIGFSLTHRFHQLIGGIYGFLIMNYHLSIEILWLESSFREQRWGSLLLKTLEKAAIEKGAQHVLVDTFDFQALNFYLKHEYEIFAQLDHFPTQEHTRYYLRKKLL